MLPDSVAALRRPLGEIARQLGLVLTSSQSDALLDYLGLLLHWNRTYNLTAVRDPERMLVQHIADCLAVIGPLCRHLATSSAVRRVLDVGSGGGLPGVVIATMDPAAEVVCVDTSRKKAAFIQQVAGSIRLPHLRSVHARVEELTEPPFGVVISRAFASLSDFTRLTRPTMAADGVWVAMKGKVPNIEIEALLPDIAVFHVEQLAVPQLDAARCLVWMRQSAPRLPG